VIGRDAADEEVETVGTHLKDERIVEGD